MKRFLIALLMTINLTVFYAILIHWIGDTTTVRAHFADLMMVIIFTAFSLWSMDV